MQQKNKMLAYKNLNFKKKTVPMKMWAAVKLVYPIQQTSAGREALILLWQL